MLTNTAELCAVYACEPLTDALWEELLPLLAEHYAEAGELSGVALCPNRAAYATVASAGSLRIFTARLGGELIGYLAAVVGSGLHHAQIKQATTDVIFVRACERRRRVGLGLLVRAKQLLASEGVRVFTIGSRVGALDFSSMLQWLGFTETHRQWSLRLDRE